MQTCPTVISSAHLDKGCEDIRQKCNASVLCFHYESHCTAVTQATYLYVSVFHLWFLNTPFPTQHTHTPEGAREHTHPKTSL